MVAISIANAKGGVGKTSMTVNLGCELAYKGYKVAMLDLDCQCDLTKVYRPADSKAPNIMDILRKKCRIGNAIIPVNENLHLLSGSKDISRYNFSGGEQSLCRVRQWFEENGFDCLLIDHPPALHEAALAGYVISDEILIVCEAESFSIENLDQLMQDIEGIKKAFQPNLHILGIAMNKIDRRRCLTQINLKRCRHIFGETVFRSMISNDTAVPNALSLNIPVRSLHWRSRTVTQFSKLAAEMLKRLEVQP